MLRFYSVFSPHGTPEPAALAAAMEAQHEWLLDRGIATLRVLGIQTMDVVFCRVGNRIYIHQPDKIIYVSLPPGDMAKEEDYAFEPWESGSVRCGSRLFVLPTENPSPVWQNVSGKTIDLVEKDKMSFERVSKGLRRLPMFSIGSHPGVVLVSLPLGVAQFLEAQHPNGLSWSLRTGEKENTIVLQAKTDNEAYEREQFFLEREGLFSGENLVIQIHDGVSERTASWLF